MNQPCGGHLEPGSASGRELLEMSRRNEELTIERDGLLAEVRCWRRSFDWRYSPRQDCLYATETNLSNYL